MELGQVMDKQIGMSCVIATALWVVSLIVWGIGWGLDVPALRSLAIIICAAGATATVRCYFIEQHQKIKSALVVTRPDPPVRSLT